MTEKRGHKHESQICSRTFRHLFGKPKTSFKSAYQDPEGMIPWFDIFIQALIRGIGECCMSCRLYMG